MTLKARLTAIKTAFKEKVPEVTRAVMHRATEDLRTSGLAERALGVGDTLPAFNLQDSHGEAVSSKTLLASGPLVVTIFRGHW